MESKVPPSSWAASNHSSKGFFYIQVLWTTYSRPRYLQGYASKDCKLKKNCKLSGCIQFQHNWWQHRSDCEPLCIHWEAHMDSLFHLALSKPPVKDPQIGNAYRTCHLHATKLSRLSPGLIFGNWMDITKGVLDIPECRTSFQGLLH
jgi:hypothetical protein